MELSLQVSNVQSVEEYYNKLGLSKYFGCFDKEVRTKLFAGKFHPMVYSLQQGWGAQMAYVKLYDVTLPDDDPDNYYMEREWRSLNNIEFTLADIQKVYLPNESYKNKFIEEFPDYAGEFWLFDTQ